MKRLCARWVSGALCAVLTLSVGPLSALAAEEPAPLEPAAWAVEETLPGAEESAAEETEPAFQGEESAAGETEVFSEGEETPAGETEDLSEVEEITEVEEEIPTEVEEDVSETEETAPEVGEPLEDEVFAPGEETVTVQAAEAGEEAGEAPAPEDLFPLGGAVADGDPEDPLYARYALGLDGAGSKTWKNFTTRALKAGETLRRGIDVSTWQNTINWTKVKAAGVEFAYLRCGYRGVSTGKLVEDGRYRDYIRGALAAGIPVGVYIFSQAITVAEAVEEADYILNMVKGYDVALPLTLDLEHYPGGRFTNAKLSRRELTDIFNAFCERIEAAGYESMVYSNPDLLNNRLYPDELGRLWLAHYTSQTGYSAHEYEYWQCTSDGYVDGISTAVDLDFWFQPGTAPAAEDSGPFSDVKKGDWFYDTVLAAYEAGIVNGVSDKKFEPGGTATRAQVVTMIWRTEKTPKAETEAAFTDLTADWYAEAVAWAAEKNVVTGYTEAEFRPDRAITREELVTILYRMMGAPETAGDLSAFGDRDQVQSWAADAMAWAVENKVVTGYEDGTLRPRNNASRAEVCAILMRYIALW